MIKSITLENFQSHTDTHLEFSDGVNVIVGQSDSGKTAILRAFNWIINNKPSGEAFISHGTENVSVEVEFEDHLIKRGRGKNGNYYQVDKTKLEAFGRAVPLAISDCFNIPDLNIQSQMDGPFLLADSSGEVAQVLNKAANLDIIDSSLMAINKKARVTSGAIKEEERRYKQTQEDLEQFENLDDMDLAVCDLEILKRDYETAKSKEVKLEALLAEYKQVQFLYDSVKDGVKAESYYQDLKDDLETWKRLVKQFDRLPVIISRAEVSEKDIYFYLAVLETEASFNQMKKQQEELSLIEGQIVKLSGLISGIIDGQSIKENADKKVQLFEAEYHKKMPDSCPLCGQSMEGIK